MNRSQMLNTLPIDKGDFVVEIGAGHMPFGHTKLILDKYPFDNLERWGDIQKVAPILKADAHKLPIGNRSCDVFFASHVIEHLDRPDKFVEEIKRCSKHVYLEFPKFTRELMFAWSFHKWVVDIEEGNLIFYKNDIPQMFGDYFHKNYDLIFHVWSEQRFEELNSHLYTESAKLTCRYADETALEHVLANSALGDDRMDFATLDRKPYTYKQVATMLLYGLGSKKLVDMKDALLRRRNSISNPQMTNDILGRLACQNCEEQHLSLEGDIIECKSCATQYQQKLGVFDFDI